jgi:uncharacterized protein YlxW (UPF0749 family)
MTILDEVVQIQQELRSVQQTVETLQKRLEHLTSRLQKRSDDQQPKRLVDLEGIWAGLDLSFEVIQAVEYKLPEGF